MSTTKKITVPDIGGASNVDVIEVFIKKGDTVEKEQALITLESDKASMDIPSPYEGEIKSINLKVGDKVSEGDEIALIELVGEEHESTSSSEEVEKKDEVAEESKQSTEKKQAQVSTSQTKKQGKTLETFVVPDIGDAQEVDVIEVHIKPGQTIAEEDPLITLEGDKATMDIPAIKAGVVKALKIKVGDKVSKDAPIAEVEVDGENEQTEVEASSPKSTMDKETQKTESKATKQQSAPSSQPVDSFAGFSQAANIYASPSVRRVAREFGVDLTKVQGQGRKGRILKSDVQNYVKSKLSESGQGSGIEPVPAQDFSQFGEIEVKPLNKIKRLTAKNMHRSWLNVPHVTQFDEADITELESFRKSKKQAAEKAGYKLTVLAFVTKAVVECLREFPQFNASLDTSGESLIYKHYFNVGIAVDTPNGLVVPVIKEVDKKSVADIATEMANLSKKAREKGLSLSDMSGGCFTISSLGGIGGTAFTPIVNAPEVAILGLSRAFMKPLYQDGQFVPRLMLPLSLSYDHRVIDGAEAARFSHHLSTLLSDIRNLLL